MKDFIIYFFGKGETEEFANFSVAHFAPIVLMIAAIFLIRHFRDGLSRYKHEKGIRYILAFMLIVCEMSYFWRLVGVPSLNPNPVDHLPITVCGWAVIFCSYMVIGKSQTLFDISYFWLFSGTVFALITPTVITYTGPTRFRYYQFWLEHTLGYIAIFYMIFVHGMRPTVRSAVKSYIALAVLAVVAYAANSMIGPGANYLFMAKPEDTPSILDILPPNHALRIFIMAVVITLMYGLAYIPWHLKDRKEKREKAASVLQRFAGEVCACINKEAVMSSSVYEQVRSAISELCEKAKLKKGNIVIIGCSTSEVMGSKIGTNSNLDVAGEIFRGLYDYTQEKGVFLAIQCCEHLNRAIITERSAVPFAEPVNVIPQPKAGGSLATQAYAGFADPVAVEEIKADAGLDIGLTLIGMHLKKVAVPVRLENNRIGEAIVVAARTRPKFVGGARAVYDQELL